MSESAWSSSRAQRTGWTRCVPPAVFALAAFLAVLPLLLQGCSCGHDFDFHLLSWMEAASQWQHGILRPVWAFTPAFNAGEPRLLMYPPLSWATGAFIGLLLPWPVVPIAFTWLVLFLSGLTMHRLLRRWTRNSAATLGGCLYLVNPYMLFCAYERTAYAELMAAAWMPLLLAAMLRPRLSMWRIALVVSLVWLTNAPAAVVGCYSVLLLGLARLLWVRGEGLRTALQVAGTVTTGVVAGLALDAFYLVPMALTRKYVQLALAVVPMASPDANYLFARDNDLFHDHVLLQASWIATGTLAIAVFCGVALLWLRARGAGTVRPLHSMKARDLEAHAQHDLHAITLTLTVFAAVLWYLLSRWSSPIWHIGPELVYLQFPWRFLSVASAAAIALGILLVQRSVGRLRMGAIIVVGLSIVSLAGVFAGGRYFREECASDETVQSQREQFVEEDGVGTTDEYTPVGADNDVLPVHLPPAWLTHDPMGTPDKTSTLPPADRSHPEDWHIVTGPVNEPVDMVVRLRFFPGWHILRDSVEIQPGRRPDGLAVVPLAPGRSHTVEVQYRTTAGQWAGLAITGMTLLSLATWAGRRSGIMGHPA